MLKASHRNCTRFRSPTGIFLNRLRLIFCVPGPSRIPRPEFPGANGRKPYASGEQLVRLIQPGTCTNAAGLYQGKSTPRLPLPVTFVPVAIRLGRRDSPNRRIDAGVLNCE